MIQLKNVSKFYYSKGVIATGFSKVNLSFDIGEFVAITGESGSGKSTLLNVISGLETYEEGEMFVEGKETSHYIEKDWEVYRRKYIGNIYQNFNLINSYTVYQNIDVILSLNGVCQKERKQKILTLLKRVDMLKYKNTKVSKLSGGQKQRVAIARALAKDVPVIIADEPTGNLDKRSAESIIELLREISKDKLIIIVTHNFEQVADYVTRKITMHDGRVLEDKKQVDFEKQNISLDQYSFKNIRLWDEIKLGIRNTFNICIKFILLFAVYSFIVCALMGEYSFFKEGEYELSKQGYNYVFQDLNDHRIIFNKKDKTFFTAEEVETIKKLKNIDYVVENDMTADYIFDFAEADETEWYNANAKSISLLKIDHLKGRLPENDNEIVLEAEEGSYALPKDPDKILNHEIFAFDPTTGTLNKTEAYTIVGVRYIPEGTTSQNQLIMYVSDSKLKELHTRVHRTYSRIKIDFVNRIYQMDYYSNFLKLTPNAWIDRGKVYISEEENYRCDKFNCVGQTISVTVSNIYYTKTSYFTIAKTYNKKNINQILDLPNYNQKEYEMNYSGPIYMNIDDYEDLFSKDSYQMSVYVKDVDHINETEKQLQDMGYHTLKIKDTLVKETGVEIIRVLKIVMTLGLVFVLFFITYFVIKIILKSRNIYYSILRMLGASKKVCRNLLMIELFTVTNLSYFTFLMIAEINRRGYIHVGFINTVNRYFANIDYIILYVILILMSLFISLRYSRKLFKDSVMNTYREEM